MKSVFKRAALVALALLASVSFGQGVTTASMSGLVTDKNNDPLPGAVFEAVHEPTGTRYSAVTRADGRFKIFNMRVGGPYKATVTMTGFRTQTKENLFLKLGEDLNLNFTLELDTVEETLVVVGESGSIINPSRTGAASNVSNEMITKLPSVSRNIEDFARTSPFFSLSEFNGGTSSLTIAGKNNRYNNILIDGAVNNDVFGLAGTGVPGGQAEAQPISLEAIQELQLVVAPYDVRQGGFAAGGLNAITKSGTNNFSGSAFHYWRSDSQIGDGPDDRPFGVFEEKQSGVSVGGPIVKDKVFFFASAELRRRERPTDWAIRPDGTNGVGQNFGRYDEAVRFYNALRNNYGYDPGSFNSETGNFDPSIRNTDSDNFFMRLDFNINDQHQLTFRHNYVEATNLLNFAGSFTFQFDGNAYLFPNKTNSTVVQLNSTFGSFFNELRFTYTTIKDRREGVSDPFPWIEIENLPGGGEFEAGTERFSTRNALDQEILEITDDFTFFLGNHTITLGTHNEFFSFDNLFIRENFGAYQFASLEDFERGWVRQYDRSFSATSDPLQSSKFDVAQLGFYAGDQWAVTPDLNLTMGLRLDIPLFPDKPTRNPQSETEFGLRTDELPDGELLWSPRVGFNWDIDGQGKHQLRGGTGIFTGRAPFVWISNQYANTGIEFTRIQARVNGTVSETNHIVFNPDPFNQPTTVSGASTFTNEIDLMDPNFKMPQSWRTNIAYDRELGWMGLIGTLEVIYSKNVNEIRYQNLNKVPTGATAFDGRPQFRTNPNGLSDVIFLTNTSQGSQTNAAIKVERPFKDGWSAFVSYLWGDSKAENDGTSSQALSNWSFTEVRGNPNQPELSQSDFDVEHRFNASVSYEIDWKKGWATNLSFFYNAQSGRPYSTIYSGDANGDGQFSNDLIYVPNSADEVIIQTGFGTWEQLNAYINADEGLRNARGTIVGRNASREPWQHTLDFRAAQDVSFGSYRFQVTLDILNFWNLIDSDSGQVKYANNNAVVPINFRGYDTATGKPIFRLNSIVTNPANNDRFSQDDLRSRWQGKFGVRFSF